MLHKSIAHTLLAAYYTVVAEVRDSINEWGTLIQEGYDSQNDITDNRWIDLIINLAAVFAAHLVYSPVTVTATVTPEWSIWSDAYLIGEEDVFFPIVAPLLYVTQFAGSLPDYRTLQQWCKSVHLPAKGTYDKLHESWLSVAT